MVEVSPIAKVAVNDADFKEVSCVVFDIQAQEPAFLKALLYYKQNALG